MPDQDPWPHLQRHAAQQLRGDLVDRVLRQHRLAEADPKETWQSLGLALLTAAACVTLVVALGQRLADADNARNYAAWSEVARQTSLIARLP